MVNDYKKGTKLKVIAKLINENDWIHSDPLRQDFVRPNGELGKVPHQLQYRVLVCFHV